ncbi:MAG: response regulator transcription factor, partial [Candidatus Hinthialibacter sp.]
LELISKGLKPSQVAEALNLSPKTIENYRANLRIKLNLRNASELFQYAIEWKTRRYSENPICA